LLNLGFIDASFGELAAAQAHMEESVALCRDTGNLLVLGPALNGLGAVLFRQGNVEAAQRAFDEAVPLNRAHTGVRNTAVPLCNRGYLHVRQGDLRAGAALLRESLVLGREDGDLLTVVGCLGGFGLLAATQGQHVAAARFFGAADAGFALSGATLWPAERLSYTDVRDAVRARLGEETFAAAVAAGAAVVLEQAVAWALAEDERAAGASGGAPAAPAYPDGLSAREVEVLRLLAAGKSNQEIAAALVISLRTAAFHVANILGKTGAANRTEAAAYAYQHHLVAASD
jgi:DNA-binding CsgD family transcriptional regulator